MNYGKVLLISVSIILLTACAAKEAPSSVTAILAAEKEKSTSAESWEEKWDSTIKEARKEGRVVLYSTSAGRALNDAGAILLLKKEFGLELEIITRRGGELMATMLAQHRAGIFLADVLIVGMNTFFATVEPADMVESLEPALMLPEIPDPKNWYQGEIPWANKERTALHMYAGPNTMVAVNTNFVKPEEIGSYYDLLNPKYKGKILMNDPTIAGTGLKSFSVLGWHILDLDFFRQLERQKPMITREWRQQVEWLSQGKYALLLFPHSGSMAEFIQAGASIAHVLPKEGSYLSRGGGAVSLVKRAPHSNAASVFINWLFTIEGQTLISPAHGIQSARLGVSTEGLDPLKIRKPDVKYFTGSDSKEWISRDEEYKKAALEILGHLMR